jgi:hypothetical protein
MTSGLALTLSAPERIFALAVARRQQQVRSSRVQRVEQRFGTDGIALLAAGLAWLTIGELVAVGGILLLPLSDGFIAGYALLILAMGFGVLTGIRITQGLQAGRTFRAAAD